MRTADSGRTTLLPQHGQARRRPGEPGSSLALRCLRSLFLSLLFAPCLMGCVGAQPLPGPGGWMMGNPPRGVPIGPQPRLAPWDPDRQYEHARNSCATAQTNADLDGCQYSTEQLSENLESCSRNRDAVANRCAKLLPSAREQLAQVNRNPDLLDHRANQRQEMRDNSVRSACASANPPYFSQEYQSCARRNGVAP